LPGSAITLNWDPQKSRHSRGERPRKTKMRVRARALTSNH
jgi:hypothetical protein